MDSFFFFFFLFLLERAHGETILSQWEPVGFHTFNSQSVLLKKSIQKLTIVYEIDKTGEKVAVDVTYIFFCFVFLLSFPIFLFFYEYLLQVLSIL